MINYLMYGAGTLIIGGLVYYSVRHTVLQYYERRRAAQTILQWWRKYKLSKLNRKVKLDLDLIPMYDPPVLEHTPTITIIGSNRMAFYMKIKFKEWLFRVRLQDEKDESPVNTDYAIAFGNCVCPLNVYKTIYVVDESEHIMDITKSMYMLIHPGTIYGRVHELTTLYQRVLDKPEAIMYSKRMFSLIHVDTLCSIVYACMKSHLINMRVDATEPHLTSERDIYETLLKVTGIESDLYPLLDSKVDFVSTVPDLRPLRLIIVPEPKGLYSGLKEGLISEKTLHRLNNAHLQ
jgi:hypothetical protein